MIPHSKREEEQRSFPLIPEFIRQSSSVHPMATPTLRSLARSLGLSRTTISDALRGSPRVNPETVQRVRAAAEAAGYERNPLTAAVMSHLRRSSGQKFRGVIGAIEMIDGPQTDHAKRYNESVFEGVTERANRLGFKVERFQTSPDGVRLNRLDTILHTRGIQGLVILPVLAFPDFSALSWPRYTGVYIDYLINHPPLHCVCSDHYRSMIALLQTLHERGYHRPGLYMEIPHDERLHFRWEGAFLALQRYLPGIDAVPVLRLKSVTRDDFASWFKKYDPDVVIGHKIDALGWMKECGAKTPKTHGFVCLNSLRTNGDCAALDFQAPQLGARAAELVIGQLLHNEFGVPPEASLTTIPARLVEGPTLRTAAPKKRAGGAAASKQP
ncbi:DNA-binding transcriptional repressor MalI [mine drainage metagenome]|uniref:DNA-binding transcriptional repressor MalI n=1 Tax=mine drainage metagenome TaxID=410659 RepID=A0A1J5RFV7_9ZZZZ